jgi:hypothetical protein
MLLSVVALPPAIDVPRTIPIGLTDAALHRPTRSAAVATTIVVIAMIPMMAVTDIDVEC